MRLLTTLLCLIFTSLSAFGQSDEPFNAFQIPLSTTQPMCVDGTTEGSTSSNILFPGWQEPSSADGWWKFVALTDMVQIDLNPIGLNYPMLGIAGANLTPIMGVSQSSGLVRLVIPTVPGETYYVVVGNYNGALQGGNYNLCFISQGSSEEPSVANDGFSGAIELSNVNNYCSSNGEFTNTDATADGSRPSNWQNGPNNNVWFKFQAQGEFVNIELDPSGMDYGSSNISVGRLYYA